MSVSCLKRSTQLAVAYRGARSLQLPRKRHAACTKNFRVQGSDHGSRRRGVKGKTWSNSSNCGADPIPLMRAQQHAQLNKVRVHWSVILQVKIKVFVRNLAGQLA